MAHVQNENPKAPYEKAASSDMAVLADKLEVALGAGARKDLTAFVIEVDAKYKSLFRSSPELRDAVRSLDVGPDLNHMLYYMGQLSFASRFAGMVVQKRECGVFLELLKTFSNYVDVLSSRECSGVALSEILNYAPETVSRHLKRLRDAGIVDYRRERTEFINFLTPAARAYLGHEKLSTPIKKAISSLKSNVGPVMRRQIFLGVGEGV